ncbi:endo alpha-1,4 polygalactosaminidase [Actinomadura hibisca]|uniref:endo alpha-1,4 polygalactosaminidase n=1 Tax=Actinomadura hibisca TaxID=68565 RepID=UPI00082F7B89|nr:endo alpha-1,4 polygalactosaminidase [Actinomadura hibisca]
MRRKRLAKAGGIFSAAAALTTALAPSTATAATAAPGPDVRPKTVKALWKPPLNARWQYQLTGNSAYPQTGGVNVNVCSPPQGGGACVRPQVFDIDLYADANVVGNNNTLNTAAVQAIHARGAKAICYVDAGGIEKVRPDYQQFVDWHNANGKSLIGKAYPGFPDENYANINNDRGQRDFVLRMTEARVAKCVQAGFDGVEFDVVNAYEEGKAVTGWNISAATQLTFNRALADLAHRYGLSVALKNDLSQIPQLVSSFDYAVNEQCLQYTECDDLKLFVQAGKPVFQVEYETDPKKFCGPANTQWNFNAIKKGADAALTDLPYTPCR